MISIVDPDKFVMYKKARVFEIVLIFSISSEIKSANTASRLINMVIFFFTSLLSNILRFVFTFPILDWYENVSFSPSLMLSKGISGRELREGLKKATTTRTYINRIRIYLSMALKIHYFSTFF